MTPAWSTMPRSMPFVLSAAFSCESCRNSPDRQLTSAGAKYLVPAQERPRGKCSAGSLGAVLTTVRGSSRYTVTPTEYFLLASVALIVAGFVAVLVWNLWLTPAEHERIKTAASKS
jgi:hypothetical protein